MATKAVVETASVDFSHSSAGSRLFRRGGTVLVIIVEYSAVVESHSDRSGWQSGRYVAAVVVVAAALHH